MESCVSEGLVADGEGLFRHLSGMAELGWARCELPLLKRCFFASLAGDWDGLFRWSSVSLAMRETEELLLEERELGRAVSRLLKDQGLAPPAAGDLEGLQGLGGAAAFGLLAAAMGLLEEDAGSLLSACLWSLAEGQALAAAKAVPLGQAAVQGCLLRLMPLLPGLVSRAMELGDGGIGPSLPMRAVLSSWHEESPLRMFRS
jgi:urease accessory protein